MTDKRITDLTELTDPESGDFLVSVDVSDTTSSAEGTTKKVSVSSLLSETQFFGWASYQDTQYTSSAPLNVLDDTRTLLPNNAGTTINTYLNESTELWINDEIRPIAVGDAYDVRLTFVAEAGSNETDITLDLDINPGGTPNIIYQETRRLLRGSNTPNNFSFSIPIYTLNTFVTNGGSFYVTPSVDTDIYGISILIVKTFRNI